MDIAQILPQVKSPFTDELIQKLIEMYISCGGDEHQFYAEINNLGITENIDNSFTKKIIRYVFDNGMSKNNDSFRQSEPQFLYEQNDFWVVVYSDKDPMKEKQRQFDDKSPLIYRFYLNIKGKEKSNFILNYMQRCKANNLPYKLKFSREDSRTDQVIILSTLENFGENLSIIEELTADLQLGKLPMLVGEYRDGIGITEEYYNRLYSPTKLKVALVRCSVKKYLCDYIDEFNDMLSDEEKKMMNRYIYDFTLVYDELMEQKARKGQRYRDFEKKYYQRKSSIDCAKEHIENDSNAYVCGDGLISLGKVIQQVYSRNPEHFIHEVTQNFRIIGAQVWGLSEDFVFSNETEAMMVQYLEQRETELSALEEESRKYGDVEVLISKLEQREGQNIGE